MSHSVHVKATHKAIQTYYQTLKDYREHGVGHETALRSAFQNLLAETAKTRHWLLVPEQSTKSGGKPNAFSARKLRLTTTSFLDRDSQYFPTRLGGKDAGGRAVYPSVS